MTSADSIDLPNLYERLSHDESDLVAVGRALVINPDWATKIRDGRAHELQSYYNGYFERLSDAEIEKILRSRSAS